MGDLKFVPQRTLDDWTDLGKIEIDGSTLRIPSENATFHLTPAVHFVALVEGEDEHRLVGRVKTERHVRDIGGELLTDSCIVGDTAYQVQPGFLAERDAATPPAPSPAGAGQDAEFLTRFLLESLD